MFNIQELIDDEKCYVEVRKLCWPAGVRCPQCGSAEVAKWGKHNRQKQRQRYQCKMCSKQFDDLTDSIFEGHHQPLKVWVLCLYFMSLNLSNQQIAQELGLNKDDVQQIISQLRSGVVQKKSRFSASLNQTEEPVPALDQSIVYTFRGNTYGARGEYDHAIDDFNRALACDPQLAETYNNRGFAYYNKSDHNRAVADLDQAITLDPRLPEAYNNRGIVYRAESNYDRAIADFDQAITLDPQYALAYISRSLAHSDQGDQNRAKADFGQALALDPRLYMAVNLQHYTDYFNQIIETSNNYPDSGVQAGE